MSSIEAIRNSAVIPAHIKASLIESRKREYRKSTVSATQVRGSKLVEVDIRASDIHLDYISPTELGFEPFYIAGIGIDPETGNKYLDSVFQCWLQPSTGFYTPRILLSDSDPDRRHICHMVTGPACRSSLPEDRDDRNTVYENAAEWLMNRADFRGAFGPMTARMRRKVAMQYIQWLREVGFAAWSNDTDDPECIPTPKMRVRSAKGGLGQTLPYPLHGTI